MVTKIGVNGLAVSSWAQPEILSFWLSCDVARRRSERLLGGAVEVRNGDNVVKTIIKLPIWEWFESQPFMANLGMVNMALF